MSSFLVLASDHTKSGRGVRGLTLYRFLCIFAGAQNVQLVTINELRSKAFFSADYLFIAMPSRLTSGDLTRVRYRDVILFDYFDRDQPFWEGSDRDFLQGLTNRYWKPCVEADLSPHVRWGCLPIRRSWKQVVMLRAESLRKRVVGHPTRTRVLADIGFLGCPTALAVTQQGGKIVSYPQRIQWLLELRRTEHPYSFWGGFTLSDRWRREIESCYGEIGDLCFSNRRVSFWQYRQKLKQCRSVLSPAGNARWTYRHYEAVYSGNPVICTDLRKSQLLVPLPKSVVISVPDHAPLLPYIDQALAYGDEHEDRIHEGIRHLEQYLHFGDYSRKRPLVWDRFVEQLSLSRSQRSAA